MDKLGTLVPATIFFFLISFTFTNFKWEGESYTYSQYNTIVTNECIIENEWVEVDYYQINLIFNDMYKIDGQRTYSQGKDLTCRTDRERVYIGEQEGYKIGMKDIIFFWKDDEDN